MKILLAQPFGHIEGHMPMYTKLLTNALAKVGADVTVCTFDGNLEGLGKNDAKVKHISFCTEAGIFAHPLRWLERLLNCGGLLGLGPYMDTFLILLYTSQQAKKQPYDAVHVLDAHPFPILNLIWATFLKNYNLLFNLNFTSHRRELQDWSKRFRNSLRTRDYPLCRHLLATRILESAPMVRIKELFYRRAIKRNHLAFVCHSQQVQESYDGSFFDDRIACVPWGMQKIETTVTPLEARKHLNLVPNGKVFLSFGVNHKEKNLEVIFQAIQDIPKDFKILHAGKVDQAIVRNDPTKLAEKYGWSKNTIIEDRFIPEDEMPYYFLAADVLVLSYTRDFLHASGLLAHASGFSLPVIASDVGQLGELVKAQKLGLTFTTEDAISLREAIVSFLVLPEEEKQTMKRNLEEFAATFSWEEVARKHLDIYQGLLDE